MKADIMKTIFSAHHEKITMFSEFGLLSTRQFVLNVFFGGHTSNLSYESVLYHN
jgi:hypothetical protein